MIKNSSINLLHLSNYDCNSINSINSAIKSFSIYNANKNAFYIVDLEDILNKHTNWMNKLPRVKPFYAVKCNPDIMLLRLFAFLGTGFDCASQNEIEQILEIGVSPDRIIFANPCKQKSYIEYAHKVRVDCMTFDNQLELDKIKENHPRAKCVLRMISNDENAKIRLSKKSGADMKTSFKLIAYAIELGLDLVGISFHVGSGQSSPSAYFESIANARQLFNYALEQFSHKMYLLNIGGGYPGSFDSLDLFNLISQEINRALDEYFPKDLFSESNGYTGEREFKIIAEPGRYYPDSAFTLCANVIAKRETEQSDAQQNEDTIMLQNSENKLTKEMVDSSKSIMYYINDGIFGSFNPAFGHQCFPTVIKDCHESSRARSLFKSTIWGQTCYGNDLIIKDIYLPEHNLEDYFIFKNMGAYTLSCAVTFNGMPIPECLYIVSSSWDKIRNAFKNVNITFLP